LNRQNEKRYLVAAFYKFVPLPDYREVRESLQQRCTELNLLGSILLAEEGINGTVSGHRRDVIRLFEGLRSDKRLRDLHYKESWAENQPFHRMKVRLKKEIVSLGVKGVDPNRVVGEYVNPGDWNELISREDVRLVDTRNHYEYHLGTFKGAEDPGTGSFRDFPQWVADNLDPETDRVKRPPPICWTEVSEMSTTSMEAFSTTSRASKKKRACGKATVLYSIIA
jgi:UPF0176 protein